MAEFIVYVIAGIIGCLLYKYSKKYREWVDDPFGVNKDNRREAQ